MIMRFGLVDTDQMKKGGSIVAITEQTLPVPAGTLFFWKVLQASYRKPFGGSWQDMFLSCDISKLG
jgi:hypothetical protein